MSRLYLALALVLAYALAAGLPGQARPVDLAAPSGTLGSSDAMGFVETWEEVRDIDFGGGLTLPFRFGFTSNPERTSSFFGKGWIIPLWEARAVMVNETSMRAELPCGKVMYLHCTAEDPTHFHTQDGAWQAILDPEAHTFSVTRDDGWLLKYENGRLAELKTDQGRDIVWNYSGGQFASLEEGGHRPLEVTTDNGGQPTGFVVNGQTYAFTLDRRPLVQDSPAGRVIGELAPTLGSFTWPGGRSDTFKFSVASDLTPQLMITDAGGQKQNYTWDLAGHILSDNGWKYTVGDIVPDSNLPALSRTNAAGQSEGVRIATEAGVITETSLQGVVTTTKIFRTPGPYFNKVREISQTVNGVTRVLQRRGYDEAGRLIRSMDESGTITAYTYDSAGKLLHQAVTVDPQVLAQLQQKEAEMLKAIAATSNPRDKNQLLQDLGFYYVHEMKDEQKALALAESLPDHDMGYAVAVQAIFYDDNLNAQQKIAEYRKLLPFYPQCAGGINSLIKNLQPSLAQP